MKKIVHKSMAILAISILAGCAIVKMVSIEPYQKIVTANGKSKSDLYFLVNQWMVETFRSAPAVIEFQDKDYGSITGKCILTSVIHSDHTVYFDKIYTFKAIITLDCRDNAVRLTLKPVKPIDIELREKAVKPKFDELAADLTVYLQQEIWR
jgi:hypothetical protein